VFFKNRQKQIEDLLCEYRQQVCLCIGRFENSFRSYCETEWNGSRLKENCIDVHAAESRADDIRREIEVLMYTKALFPESRGDMLGLLETMDRIPNQAQRVIRKVSDEHIKVPLILSPKAMQLAKVACSCANVAVEASEKLFTNYTIATAAIGKVDELESEADRLYSDLVESVFNSNLESIDKLLLRDLFESMEAISDRAENVADRIRIIVAKRRI
jgi:predicted phosphate transport protein (TIGR00153 family)